MSFSATDCPLDDTCMDIHMSEKTPTSLGHQLREMEREANATVVSLAVVVEMVKLVEVVVMEMAKVVVMDTTPASTLNFNLNCVEYVLYF